MPTSSTVSPPPSPRPRHHHAAPKVHPAGAGASGLKMPHHAHHSEEADGNNKLLLVMFSASLALLWLSFASFPAVSEDEWQFIKFPRNVDDLRALYAVLSRYRDVNYWSVLSGFSCAYIFLQTFAIPGAIFLSVLAGPLFGVYTGLFIVSTVATLGGAMCYLTSYYLGRGLVQRCFPAQLEVFRGKIREQEDNLFFYLLFLRISPLLPNWFISVSSPILNVPLSSFVAATAIGLIPANYIHVNTGMQLEQLQSANGINLKSILALFGIAFLALIPTLFKKRFQELEGRMARRASVSSSI